jgi:hypothetical protein
MIIEEFEEEQNPSGRITDGFPDMTLGSYILSASACNAVAAKFSFTLFNCDAAAEFPLPEPLMGNAVTCMTPGDDIALILYWCV